MSREDILNPIEKYMKERAERDTEICEVNEKLKEAEVEYYKSRSKVSAVWERSWNLSYHLDDIDHRVLELQDSINASMDGRMLCDHSTVMFLKALDDLLDKEISYIKCRTDIFKDKVSVPQSDVWKILIVTIAAIFGTIGIYVYLIS